MIYCESLAREQLHMHFVHNKHTNGPILLDPVVQQGALILHLPAAKEELEVAWCHLDPLFAFEDIMKHLFYSVDALVCLEIKGGGPEGRHIPISEDLHDVSDVATAENMSFGPQKLPAASIRTLLEFPWTMARTRTGTWTRRTRTRKTRMARKGNKNIGLTPILLA